MKVCMEPGCPTLTKATRCAAHTRERDKARGTRQERGYGATHARLRAEWAPLVATGHVKCARCREPIAGDAAWDLDHTADRAGYLGPSHASCNRAARRFGSSHP